MKNQFLPINEEDVRKKGWDSIDIVLITGDAYIDYPSFGIAIIGRVLEAKGFRVAILNQPDWYSKKDFQKYCRPNLYFGISSGNMDSMVNKYTALRKVRNDDAYSEGGMPFKKPNRATIVYAQRAKEAYKDVPIIIGGIEASLRRFAHYDFWSDRVKKSIIFDSKADLLIYGMGEKQAVEIAERLKNGEDIKKIRNIRGTSFILNEKDKLSIDNYIKIPSFEEVSKNNDAFNRATKIIHQETNPYNSKTIIQYHGKRAVVQLPPAFPLTEREMDKIYSLPYTKNPHPIHKKSIPAYEMIKNSVTIMRGCFGGCSFCSIALHQGGIIQSRSEQSILKEIKEVSERRDFSGVITDIGGPTANMYKMEYKDKNILQKCKRLSCIYPTICKNLNTTHKPLLALMEKARNIKNVSHVFVSSGIRMDLALLNRDYIKQIVFHHTSGYLKVAPEHISDNVLSVMKKPKKDIFESFQKLFYQYTCEAKKEQYLILYLISSHPGADIESELELALYLKRHKLKPKQIQDFLPSPMDIATSIYYTGKNVYVAKNESEKKLHRAIIQYFKRENRPVIIKALRKLHKEYYAKELLK